MFKINKVIFTNILNLPDIYPPQPASKDIPDWYKKMDSYINNEKKPVGDGSAAATIKKCLPVFDSITMGYIIYSTVDVYVSIKDGIQWFEWASMEPIKFHPILQAPNHPKANEHAYPKWINQWSVKTPPGYSCLFTQPKHRDLPFTIFDGFVDTDIYDAPVNFPFVINNPTWEGLIPAGTPIAQVIPIKRDSFKMELGSEKNIKNIDKTNIKLKLYFYDGYKKLFWRRKEYK